MENWPKEDYEDYFQTLVNAFNHHLAVGLLRLRGGMDLVKMANQDEFFNNSLDSGLELENSKIESDPAGNSGKIEKILSQAKWSKSGKRRQSTQSVLSDEIFEKARVFRSKKKLEGTIDVYWLYDDGGLTLLLPYILSTRTKYANSKLRIFFLSNKVELADEETRSMVELMAKFRIDCEDIVAIQDPMNMPSKITRETFLKMVQDEVGAEKVSEEMLKLHAKKVNFKLRIAEIVRDTSCMANLVVMTLPVPKKEHLPPALYMSILEYTTRDMPPFLYLRGNQESVLTFYS